MLKEYYCIRCRQRNNSVINAKNCTFRQCKINRCGYRKELQINDLRVVLYKRHGGFNAGTLTRNRTGLMLMFQRAFFFLMRTRTARRITLLCEEVFRTFNTVAASGQRSKNGKHQHCNEQTLQNILYAVLGFQFHSLSYRQNASGTFRIVGVL